MLNDFKNKYKNLLGNEFNDFYDALNIIRPKSFRINIPRKINYLSEVKKLTEVEKNKDFDNIYSLKNYDFNLTNTIGFLTGGIYIQNPSSMFPVKILKKYLPENPVVLDMSSAPGGKTTALSEILNRKGLIVANEISPSRLKDLHFNLEKYTAWNVKTICKDGRILNKIFNDFFDGILLDAPCSNENKIIKNKEVASAWNNDFVLKMQKLQKELIMTAFDTLKPGGTLVYSTCTFSVEENEEVISFLLKNKSNAEILDINNDNYPQGLSDNKNINRKIIRILPHQMPYDGFFIAAVKKKGELNTDNNILKNKNKLLSPFFNVNEDFPIIKTIENLAFAESKLEINSVKFKKTGIKAGKMIKNDLEISSQMIWEFSNFLRDNIKFQISYRDAIEFLKGNDIKKYCDKKGVVAIFYENIPVGAVKPVQSKLKNKLDRFFLYGRNL